MQTEKFSVTGMTCGGCTSKVTKALKAVSGVSDVGVSLDDGEATVKFDEKLTSSALLKSAVRDAGYDVEGDKPAGQRQGKGCCCG